MTTKKPPFLQLEGLPTGWLAWLWAGGQGDWHGANCLDGNALSRGMVAAALEDPLAERIAGPQTLEMSLNSSGIATSIGICANEPQVINLAYNRVSSESYWYPHGTLDADKLLGAWESGYQLNLSLIRATQADSCHIICDLSNYSGDDRMAQGFRMSRERAEKKWVVRSVHLNIEPPRPTDADLDSGSGVSLSGVPQTVDALLSDRAPSEKRFL